MNLQLEPPIWLPDPLRFKSWFTRMLYSHTFSLPTDKGKLVRNHCLDLIREKVTMPTHWTLFPISTLSLFIPYFGIHGSQKKKHNKKSCITL